MRIAILASASTAIALTLALFDSTPAEAAKNRTSRSEGRPPATVRPGVATSVKTQTLRKSRSRRRCHNPPKLKVEKKIITKTPLVGTGSAAAFAKKGGPQLKFKGLPFTQAVASTSMRVGRVGLPTELETQTHARKGAEGAIPVSHGAVRAAALEEGVLLGGGRRYRLLTIPEIYYDRFLGYVSVDDPDYDGCINILSLAALEEEEEIVRVRRPMPANAVYRYSATVAPEPVSSGPSCAFEPFIERNWSRPTRGCRSPRSATSPCRRSTTTASTAS